MQQRSEQTRQRVTEAALELLQATGGASFTLDAVARAAGVSKGGLLHHFASKEALLEAVLRHVFTLFELAVAAYAAEEHEGSGRWLRAYVRATYDEEAPPLDVGFALLGVIADQPTLLTLVRDDAQRWRDRLANDGVRPELAAIIRQAADAYWTELLIGLGPQTREERQKLRDALLELTRKEQT